MDLTDVPLLDHHCHPLLRPGAPVSAASLRGHFSEATDPAMAEHLGHTVLYRRVLRDLAAALDCEATEEAVLAAREAAPPEELTRRFMRAAGPSAMLVDTGYAPDPACTLPEQEMLAGCPQREILRIETLAERLIRETELFREFEEALRATLTGAREAGYVALKSVAAYRGGLDLDPHPSREAAAADYQDLRECALRGERVRVAQPALVAWGVRAGLEAAAAQELPVQFHVGLGDDDADLRTASPLHLRPFFRDPALRAAPVVLLHCWPFVREAGYLAQMYGHVYVDLSLTHPFCAHGGVSAVREALEQAPLSKVLLASDAVGLPERFWLSARYLREALGTALETLVAEDWLTAAEADEAAALLLHRNAARLYGVEGN